MKQAQKAEILNAYFEVYYEALYQQPEVKTADAPEIVEQGLEVEPAMAKAFSALVKFREDPITSDREYAAFLLAYTDAEEAIKGIEKRERAMARKRRAYRKQYGELVGDVLFLNDIERGA